MIATSLIIAHTRSRVASDILVGNLTAAKANTQPYFIAFGKKLARLIGFDKHIMFSNLGLETNLFDFDLLLCLAGLAVATSLFI